MESTGSRDQVAAWLSAVEAEVADVDREIAPLAERRRRLEGRRDILQDLLASFDSDRRAGPLASATSLVVRRPGVGVGDFVRARVVEILKEEGPMHINDLHARYVAKGLTVPGAGKPVNLIVHLRDQTEIVSPARGMYALRGQVSEVRPVAKRKKKRKRAAGRSRRGE